MFEDTNSVTLSLVEGRQPYRSAMFRQVQHDTITIYFLKGTWA